jgi:hypothetical protein
MVLTSFYLNHQKAQKQKAWMVTFSTQIYFEKHLNPQYQTMFK